MEPLLPPPALPHDVELFFDPSCPFAWNAALLLCRAAEREPIRIGWRFLSLGVLNEARPVAPEVTELWHQSHRVLRLFAAVRRRAGNDAVGEAYRAWGDRLWYVPDHGTVEQRVARGVHRIEPADILDEVGLPTTLVDALDDELHDEVIRRETGEALTRAGGGVGTPVLSLGPEARSIFGPVLSAVPDCEAAADLYKALRALVAFPGFSELKREGTTAALPLLAGCGAER